MPDEPRPAPEGATIPDIPLEYVCWCPGDDEPPAKVTSRSAEDAAKVHVLREQAKANTHSNDWSASHVLVVGYDTGDVYWVTVKVTVVAS
jgi:hypothetical protein